MKEFWGETGQANNERFNQEVNTEFQRLHFAMQGFEELIARHSKDYALGNKSELDTIRENSRAFFVAKSKECLVDACSRHQLQHFEMKEADPDSMYHFRQYLHYSNPAQKTALQGSKYVETVSFKMAEDIDDHDQPMGDEMTIRFMLPQTFITDADMGSLETNNWLATVNEVVVNYTSADGKTKLPEYVVSPDYAYPNHPITGQFVKKMVERAIKTSRRKMLKLDLAEASHMLSILPKLKDMKLCPFSSYDIPVLQT